MSVLIHIPAGFLSPPPPLPSRWGGLGLLWCKLYLLEIRYIRITEPRITLKLVCLLPVLEWVTSKLQLGESQLNGSRVAEHYSMVESLWTRSPSPPLFKRGTAAGTHPNGMPRQVLFRVAPSSTTTVTERLARDHTVFWVVIVIYQLLWLLFFPLSIASFL